MPAAAPAQAIDDARRAVREALSRWQGTNLDRINECRDLLDQSVADLRMAIDLLHSGASHVTRDFEPKITGLRREISMMIRLVDACTAFHRGMRLQRGTTDPAYDASGQTVGESGGVSAHGVIG